MALTRELGEFVNRVVQEGASRATREAARIGLADSVATMIAGAREPATQILLGALAPLPPGPCVIVAAPAGTAPREAALLNGVAAHALDFDDVALRGHPSAVITPAILALGQSLDSSGAQMLDAYAAGYEVWGNLVDREKDMHHMKGWHPTGIFGCIGAAAACAVLLRLDAQQCAHAIGLGASQSSGLMSNFGAMSKPLHAGRAAQAGVLAAQLAHAGFTASADALEHDQGFLLAVSPKGNVDRTASARHLGQPWTLPTRRSNIKKYPACYYTHRSIDAILDLLDMDPVAAADIQKIEVSMSREHATVLRNHAPRDALSAKFSIEFAMASAVLARHVGLRQLDDAFVASDAVQALMSRVSVTPVTDYDPRNLGAAYADRVVITTVDGARHESLPVHQASGHADRALNQAELKTKFLDCLQHGKYGGEETGLFERLMSLEDYRAGDIALR